MEDDQQFCLRWNNHQTTLIQNFDTLLESGTLVDCTLAAEGKYLKAHKVVLSACSPYFEGLLSEHYDKHPVFILKDVKFKELKAMMDYMYRGEVNISQDQLAALLKAAESLQIKGLSESRTGGNGCTKPDTRQSKVSSQSTAPSLDIPHASSGLTIEKNSKVPRQSLAQSSVGDLPEDSASPSIPKGISSREGSQSPVSRKRKRLRRRSVGEDNSIENHESNSSDMTQQPVPALGVAPVADEKSHADAADSLGRSALMQQLTKPADEMLQLPVEKPEPTEDMIQPKSEYLDDPEESVEDLTLDDDMNDLNEMEDSNRAGPSSHDPNQHPGLAAWHVTGDRSNAGGVVGSVAGGPGAQDEVFLAAHEAVQAQRDSQVCPPEFCVVEDSAFSSRKAEDSLSGMSDGKGKSQDVSVFYDSPEDLAELNLDKKDILILKKLNAIGMMLETLCQNQQSDTLNMIDPSPLTEDLFGTFHNKDDELSIFPASGELEVQLIEQKLVDTRFFGKVAYALSRLGKHTNLSLTVTNLLNQLLKFEAGERFSFLGRSGKKPAFKTTNLCSVVCCAAQKLYPTATRSTVEEYIKTWLIQCKNRRQRKNESARRAAEKGINRIFIKLEEPHMD